MINDMPPTLHCERWTASNAWALETIIQLHTNYIAAIPLVKVMRNGEFQPPTTP